MQIARSERLYSRVQHRLRPCTAWEDTALDPARYPLSPPQNDTLDGHIAQTWYGGHEVSHAFFVEKLQTHHHYDYGSRGAGDEVGGADAEARAGTSRRVLSSAQGERGPRLSSSEELAVESAAHQDVLHQPRGAEALGALDGGAVSLRAQQPLVDDVTFASDTSGHAGFRPRVVYTVMVNETAKHALPTAINMMSNALLGALSSGSGEPDVGRIRAAVDPYPIIFDEQRVRPVHLAPSAMFRSCFHTEHAVSTLVSPKHVLALFSG